MSLIDSHLVKYWEEGSVCGLHPREAISIRITEGRTGWFVGAYTGDGSKPGSLMYGAGGFPTPEQALAYVMDMGLRREAMQPRKGENDGSL